MSEIIPAVLAQDAKDLKTKIGSLPSDISLFHLDVLESDIWEPIERDFEAHLMVEDPGAIFERWKERGAKRIIVHKYSEAMTGIEVGLGIEMHIHIDSVADDIRKSDFVHLMSISEIGEQGHPLDERIFDRIREVKERFPGKLISVDGGINISNFKKLEDAGADRLVVGSGFNELWTSLMKR